MDWWTVILAIIVAGFSIFLLYTMTYFKRFGIPHEPPLPLLGNMAPVFFRKLHFIEHTLEYYNRWPEAKYIGFYDCITPVLIVRDVELIKQTCVKNFDSFMNHRTFFDEKMDPLLGKSLFGLRDSKWREVRHLLTPAFTSSKMKLMFELISTCSKQFSDYIIDNAKQGTRDIEIKDAFTKYTNDVIASCAFGLSVDSMRNPNNEFYVLGKQSVTFNAFQISKLFFVRFCPTLSRWLNMKMFDSKVSSFFINLVKETIESRQKTGITRRDMLQLMMEQNNASENKLDIIEMTAQAYIFFFAGFDTSSSLMSFTAVAMSQHPDIQNKLLDEIDQVMKETNGNPNYEAINGMQYLEAVLYESLRCFPIIGFLDRICTSDFELPPAFPGLKPFTVKRGMNIWIPSGAIHSDPQHYENPDIYDPDRFLGKKLPTNLPTFVAFGIGPRGCIGNRFALIESKLVLFHLLSKCKFEKSPKLKEPITLEKTSLIFTAVIEGGFWVSVVPRNGL